MTTRTFKKNSRKNSGRRTHGYGNCQGKRKSGKKGGHGVTANWKKSMKPSMLKNRTQGYPKIGKMDNPWIYGKQGLTRPQKIIRINKINAINIGSVDAQIDKWVEKDLAEKSGGVYTLDLAKVGYNKLLARGTVTKKMNITVKKATNYAVEEIENAGGKITVLIANQKEL